MQIDIIINNSGRSLSLMEPCRVGREQCQSGHCFGPAVRDYYLIHYCVSGKGIFNDPRGSHKVSKGEMFVIKPYEITTYCADENDPWEYIWIGFRGEETQRFSSVDSVLQYPYDTFIKIKDSVIMGIDTPEIYISYIYEIMHYLFSSTQHMSDIVVKVKSYIHFYYMEDLTVERLSEMVGLNRRYLSRVFKKRYGMGIKDYIIKTRCLRGARLLQAGYTVAEAAMLSGYDDAFGFSKMFAKIMGCSPSKWRKSHEIKTAASNDEAAESDIKS